MKAILSLIGAKNESRLRYSAHSTGYTEVDTSLLEGFEYIHEVLGQLVISIQESSHPVIGNNEFDHSWLRLSSLRISLAFSH